MRSYREANVNATLKELITWAVVKSDNVTCDILFELLGGPDAVDEFIHTLCIADIAIVATEREMHDNWEVPHSLKILF